MAIPSAYDSRRGYFIAKRILDILLSILFGIIALPFVIIASIAVKLSSPGPILYRGKRAGHCGRPFFQLKLRTMRDKVPELKNPDGSLVTSAEDPRVTTVGKWLRKTSIDELPQLINIFSGEMSFIGPRPDPLSVLGEYRPKDFVRLSVLPGLSGLAAVRGRNGLVWEQRRDLDIQYTTICSFWLDVVLIIQTVPRVLLGSGVTSEGQSANKT